MAKRDYSLDVAPERLDYVKASPEAFRAIKQLSEAVHKMGLEESLLNLVNMRASQINGCAWCLNMHSTDAKKAGEDEVRITMLPTWQDVPGIYSDRERAALAWTEAVTLVSVDKVPGDVYEAVKAQFSDKEIADLTIAIIAINGWNRLNVAFRTTVVCEV